MTMTSPVATTIRTGRSHRGGSGAWSSARGGHRRGDAARIEGEERQRETTAERQRAKAEHRDREGEASNGERGRPSEAPRHRGVRDREHSGGGHAPDRSCRGGGGEA